MKSTHDASCPELTIALPRGKMFQGSVDLLVRAGLEIDQAELKSRKLEVTTRDGRFRLLLVKGGDVPIYVEYGIADLGIAGDDVLIESDADILEPLELGFSRCKVVVAAREDAPPQTGHYTPQFRVATKYPRIAEQHFARKGQPAEVVRLSGSVELGVVAGLADRIVDIVETGETLRQNGLVVEEEIMESAARLVVNRASHALKLETVSEFMEKVREAVDRGAN